MKGKFKRALRFFANPRLILCFGIAWMITNGWSYIAFGIGVYYGIGWLTAVGGSYLTFLWLPFTPEKIATVAIAVLLLRLIFPKDEKTLAVLREMGRKVKNRLKRDGKNNGLKK